MESAGGGVAPFASVEDLSDEQEQEQEQESPAPQRLTLPGADGGAGPKSPRMGVPTPRIDISRASSSSHQDDSSPERDLFTGGAEGAPVAKLGLGFTEEMAQELRNSTEELDFQDPTELETKQRRRKLHQQQAVNKYELEMQGDREAKERKDSACSDTGLLYISGRTSRLSSIGSAASGGSVASHVSGASGVSGVSGISAASHLSATSQLSRASRCSSPHKMLLETSFCGPKPIPTVSLDAEYPPKESVEATLLARQTDPTGAVLPVQEQAMVNGKTSRREKSKSTKGSSSTLSVGREPSIKSKSSERERSKPQSGRESRSSSFTSKTSRTSENKDVEVVVPTKTEEEKSTPPHRKEPPRLPPGSDAKFISLHGDEEQPVVSVSRSKSKTLPLEPDQRIIPLHGDDEPPVQSVQKKTLPLDKDSTFISLHSDPTPPPAKTPTVSTSKRKTPSKESSKTLPIYKPEPKSFPVNPVKRKEPIKYEGDQIFIPLTGDETPIVLSGGKKPPSTTTVLEGDSIIIPLHGSPEEEVKPSNNTNNIPLDKDSRIIPLKGDEIEIHTTTRKINDSDQPQPKALPPRKKPTIPPDASAVIIPLHGDEEIVALEIETDRPSSPEYGIYIPLKGPLPEGADFTKKSPKEPKPKPKPVTDVKPKRLDVKPKEKGRTPKTSPTTTEKKPMKKKEDEELVKFISLHADESERQPIKVEVQEEILDEKYDLKPEDLRPKSVSPSPGYHSDIQSIQHAYFKPDDSSAYSRKHSTSSCRSPEFEGAKVKPATLDLTSIIRPSRPVQSLTQLTRDESRTPSPATSMSRGSLFRRSSESSSSTKSRASVSSEFRTRKDSKNKTIFSSLFKKGSRDSIRRKSESSEKTTPIDPRLTKVEFTFNQQGRSNEPDTIIIPLHSPDEVPPPEVAQSISEVVAAIEELKSQPLVSPVPTPSSSSTRKKLEEPTAPRKTEPKEETVDKSIEKEIITITETEKILEIKCENEEKLDFKIKQEIEKLQEIKLEKVKPSSSVIEIKKENENVKIKQELEVTPKTSIEADISPKSEASGGSGRTQLETPLEKQESDKKSDTETIKTGSEERRSSESEPDSDAVPIPPVPEDEHERKGLFHQQESVEDELPYVPTTLPQERPVAHPIIPVKQRVADAVKTCPIERPRSTTPIDPSKLDEYVSSPHEDPGLPSREKMQIVLPRKESLRESRSKSPHKPGAKPWTHFAEQGLQSPRELRRVSSPSPPPLPPRAWVCFDEVPERRRTPKRITTLPPSQPAPSGVVYSYVNPEECSCECHEAQGRVNGAQCSDGAHCAYRT